MNHDYADIRDRIQEPVCWWDENAVPRYCPFSPDDSADIYSDEAVLLLVRCQSCGHEFQVCLSTNQMSRENGGVVGAVKRIAENSIEYGDPPNIQCCPAGPTMNSVPVKVLEYWRRDLPFDWERDATMEMDIKCDWAE